MSLRNHATRWTEDELAFAVDSWDGRRSTTEVIAEVLGRTPDAVQQRVYEFVWGTDHPTAQTKELVEGRSVDRTKTTARKTATLSGILAGEQVCPRCFLVKPATGECC